MKLNYDDAAERIVHPVTPPEARSPDSPPLTKGPTEDIVQNVRDVEALLDQLSRDPSDSGAAGSIRGMLDQMRQYDPADVDPGDAKLIDDFCSAVEAKLAKLITGPKEEGAASPGVLGAEENVGKSLGEIATEMFPELHTADAWGKPQRGAPGSGLAGFYLAARRTSRLRR